MNNSNEVSWDTTLWDEINAAVVAEVGKVRTTQKVFPTMVLETNPTEIANDVIDFTNLSIKEGQTKQFVEIYQEFPLTVTQVGKEAQLKTCKTLARMAAKAIALGEDTVIFQGKNGELPANVNADLRASAGDGLLGEAEPEDANDTDPDKVSEAIDVKLSADPKPGVLWGEHNFSAVAEGIAKLAAKAQAPRFALFLPVKAYADTFVPPGEQSLITTAERIKPLVEGGFMETVTLPQDRGLLVALAGDPTNLYVAAKLPQSLCVKSVQATSSEWSSAFNSWRVTHGHSCYSGLNCQHSEQPKPGRLKSTVMEVGKMSTSKLNLGDFGDDVARLHEILKGARL